MSIAFVLAIFTALFGGAPTVGDAAHAFSASATAHPTTNSPTHSAHALAG